MWEQGLPGVNTLLGRSLVLECICLDLVGFVINQRTSVITCVLTFASLKTITFVGRLSQQLKEINLRISETELVYPSLHQSNGFPYYCDDQICEEFCHTVCLFVCICY